ncbi:MAG: RHS repeat-associated core domain-containing protein [Candidatus Thiodiazotropha sp. (ex Lucinoma borealis)]|nr:RHS repeat-associated core domain-containing protein [Candidatus Thiodiazotropha sp. (ex Lucinoma borealis)]
MVSFTKTGTTATYVYNGKGERISKNVDGTITRFRYGPAGQLLGEYDQNGQAIHEYVYLAGQSIVHISEQQSAPLTLLQSVNLNHTAQTVDLGQHTSTPVIIASPLTYNGSHGAVVSLSNITTTQTSVQVKEWDYLDGGHAREDISLLALPPGRYHQADGSLWEVGHFTLSGTRQWHTITFNEIFEGTPYLFLTQQSQNDTETTSVRARNVSETGFQAFLHEQESLNDGHGTENIGYLAIYSPNQGGTANLYGTSFNYQLSQLSLNTTWTVHGDQQLKIQEEASHDSELGHATETLDILQIEGHLFAQDVTTNGWDTMVLRRRGPTSTVLLSGSPTEQGVVYLHTDHLGAVVKAMDGDQNLVWDAERKPFGERSVTTAQIEMTLGFPGQYFDEESGNYYNYFRTYDPSTGRYLESDPIGLEGGLNTYAYVGGNPINFVDPTGEAPLCPPGQRAVPMKNYESEYPAYFDCKGYPPPKKYTDETECKVTCLLPIPPTLLAAEWGSKMVAKELAGDLGKHVAGRVFFVYGVYDSATCWKECEGSKCEK